ncbi:MAG: DNA helicase [Deltaproteobacteria bacterium]|nr:MAG: DNA helicase [Deltaproteobacteria bacterium]
MKIRRTEFFLKDYRDLPSEIQKRVDKQIILLVQNPNYPSLKMKKLKGTDKFEVRITKGYRMTLRYDGHLLELRRVGTHDILRKED